MIELSLILFFVAAYLAGSQLMRRPENLASLVAGMGVVFGMIPALIIAFDLDFPLYSYRNMFKTQPHLFATENIGEPLLIFSGIIVLFALGGYVAQYGSDRAAEKNTVDAEQTTSLKTVSGVPLAVGMGLLLAIWAILISREYLLSGLGLFEFFLPAVREDRLEATPGFLYVIMMSIPIVCFIALRWVSQPPRIWAWFFLGLAILTCLTTHQRREIVTVILSASAIFFMRTDANGLLVPFRDLSGRARRFIIQGLMVGIVAVPGFWYLRVFLTSLTRGAAVNALELRGFTELIFGSPATGFGTFVLIATDVHHWGIRPAEFLLRLASIPVPRLLWEGKPEDYDLYLQQTYGLIENPSVFFFGEIYMSLGFLSFPAALILGWFISRRHTSELRSQSVYLRSLAIISIALSVSLFKNGVAVFLIRYVVFAALLYFLWALSRRTIRPAVTT